MGLEIRQPNVRISLAAAMSLRLLPGRFWRDAKLGCLNLLLSYADGCRGNCAYCGLARERPRESRGSNAESFIRVAWPVYPLEKILGRLDRHPETFSRVCLSMVTHPRAMQDTLAIIDVLAREAQLPISLLAAPTILNPNDLSRLETAGVERFTVAIDAATPELFERRRGREVRGPLSWSRYWHCLEAAAAIFGHGMVGSHWIVGLGESEEEMVHALLRTRRLGGKNHLFSFFPEPGSQLEARRTPPLRGYRRLQLARFLIDEDLVDDDGFGFNQQRKLCDFAVSRGEMDRIIDSGRPFFTSGCPGRNGDVACNRPFGDSRPGPKLRNYPFPLDPSDIRRVRRQLGKVAVSEPQPGARAS